MISLNQIWKVFATSEVETTALNNVSLDISPGDFVAIMGPSGCGKSTLLGILGLLDRPSGGEYMFDGADIVQCSEGDLVTIRRDKLGFIFQSFNLIDELSVFENVELPLIYQGVNRADRKKRVEEILTKVDMAHRAGHLPQQLSGGQQQRVAIARALVTQPRLILADEPTGNLDSRNSDEVMRLLSALNKEGATIVMVTHSEREAVFANRVVQMLDGSLTESRLEALKYA